MLDSTFAIFLVTAMALTWRKSKGRLRRMTRSIFPTLLGMIVGISATLIFTAVRRLPHDICSKLLMQVRISLLKFEIFDPSRETTFLLILFSISSFVVFRKFTLNRFRFKNKSGDLYLYFFFELFLSSQERDGRWSEGNV